MLQALAGATVLEAVFIMYRRLMLGESLKWTRAARVVESKGENKYLTSSIVHLDPLGRRDQRPDHSDASDSPDWPRRGRHALDDGLT